MNTSSDAIGGAETATERLHLELEQLRSELDGCSTRLHLTEKLLAHVQDAVFVKWAEVVLAQGFTGVIVQLEAAEYAISEGDRKDADSHLRRAGELARGSLAQARRSVHALRPQALEQDDFWQAFKGIVKNTTVGTTLRTTFEAQGKVPVLPPAWQENLLRIGQGALTNTLKYARAKHFGTRLICNAKEVRLELSDDGDGFQVKDRHDGVGLIGMRERTEEMGGELKIVSFRGKGTTVTAILPLNPELVL